MKNLSKIFKSTLLVLSIVITSTLSYAANKSDKKVETVVFKVEMDCMGCAGKIEKNIPFEKGVKKLDVDFKAQKVTISYKADKTSKENLKKAIEKLKFKVEEVKG
ncbi:heavy-metal-associated domain-containing protein [Marinifilum flexuosum]|uniref:Copper chaperone CopZ n=1 Tax=Marinifilum flexuosum TaxID=1117708 RepID=A0A419WSQ6_9BACT|nr:heavy metal-associated domain-containing protein [Marinifilum flexuosum]RKD98465.1 copper chaperone CopZ [Marinifilum flexuosum]